MIAKIFLDWGPRVQEHAEELPAFVEAIKPIPIEDLDLQHGDLGFVWANADLKSAAAFALNAPEDADLGVFTYYVAQRFGYEKYGPIPDEGIRWASQLTLERGIPGGFLMGCAIVQADGVPGFPTFG